MCCLERLMFRKCRRVQHERHCRNSISHAQKIHSCKPHNPSLKPKLARVYFFSTQEKLKTKKIPTSKIKLRNRTVLNLTVPTSIVRVLRRKFCADIGQTPLRTKQSSHNIKIKRNNFFEGFVGYRSVVLLMKCARENFCNRGKRCKRFYLFVAKFSRTVSLLILQKITSLIPSSL